MNSIYDLAEGLDGVKPTLTTVAIKHYFSNTFVKDDVGNRWTLEHVEVDDSGQFSMHGRPVGKNGKPKGSYAQYIPKMRYDGNQRHVEIPFVVEVEG